MARCLSFVVMMECAVTLFVRARTERGRREKYAVPNITRDVLKKY